MSAARILVVDDNLTNSRLACATLKFAGYDVFTATTAEIAEVMILASPYDLILMDVSMPGMDGLTFTRKLKASDRTRHIPIVILTASAMKGDDQKAYDAGCDGYITKPIDTRRFADQIRAILEAGDIRACGPPRD